MSSRDAKARVQSLCGTARRLSRTRCPPMKKTGARRACRYAAIWVCQGSGDYARRLAQPAR